MSFSLSPEASILQNNKKHHKNRKYRSSIEQFKKTCAFYALFKILFLSLFLCELSLFFYSLIFLQKSTLLALVIGAILLTCFTYFILLFYWQAKKPQKFLLIRERFIASCRRTLSSPKGEVEHHLGVSQSLLRLLSYLHEMEYHCYLPPRGFGFLRFLLEKMSYILHHQDLIKMRELLINAAICEHIEQLRYTPTDLEVHASLANAYVVISKFYLEMLEGRRRIRKAEAKLFHKKFDTASQRAIEELKILNDFAPNDPWVHAQLAQSYRSLNMKEDEAAEYETILQLSPNDNEVLYRLGCLYFQLGENAKGLRVFDELKKNGYKKAEDLLAYYGATQSIELLQESL